ncbi:hypothetical protein ASF70_06275 [Rhizobium sp. Leaf321]|uniref:DUF2442 domain-containing protein n=1 Tax=Rhizobium sp. Leaf321 TaxID=1736335 RepID=UPI00071299C4|nr:DUF2442 domain-containing protein [Rhizobium sp. Leaf321]KQQ73434.1 hypothetical protein ASF70_06275 [Rhizobium sp. Leaf321]
MNSPSLYPEDEQPIEAWCDLHSVHVRLADGREVITPLWWYPSLYAATPAERNNIELMLAGIHWPDNDKDLSIRGMLAGWTAPGATAPEKAA